MRHRAVTLLGLGLLLAGVLTAGAAIAPEGDPILCDGDFCEVEPIDPTEPICDVGDIICIGPPPEPSV